MAASILTKSVDFVAIELELAWKAHFHLQDCGNWTWAHGSKCRLKMTFYGCHHLQRLTPSRVDLLFSRYDVMDRLPFLWKRRVPNSSWTIVRDTRDEATGHYERPA